MKIDVLMKEWHYRLRNGRLAFIFSLIASFCVSCHRDEEISFASISEEIRFSVCDSIAVAGTLETKALENEVTCDISDWEYVENESETKASLTNILTGSTGVFGYNFTTWGESVKPTVMYDLKHTIEGGNLTPEQKVLWKDYKSGSLRFYAYAPFGKFTLSSQDTGGKPYLIYTVPTTNKDQIDILYAQSADVPYTNRESVALQFKHAMTAVQFHLGIDGATLKSVTVSGVRNSGKLFLDGIWSGQTGSGSYSVANADSLLILIPQTVPSGATVSLTYNDGSDHTISTSIAGQEWPVGKKVIYTLKKKKTDDKDDYIYFDLAVGSVEITETTYNGWACCGESPYYVELKGTHKASNKYYICQSLSDDPKAVYADTTGYPTKTDAANKTNFRIPPYKEITWNGQKWGDYITNNVNINDVEANWAIAASAVGRKSVGALADSAKFTYYKDNSKRIRRPSYVVLVRGNSTFDITIDNIWSKNVSSQYGGINIGDPAGYTYNEKVIIRLKGDNKLHKIYYNRPVDGYKGHSCTGSLTITSAEGDGLSSGTLTVTWPSDAEEGATKETKGYLGGLIGAGNTSADEDPEYGSLERQCDQMFFKGGTVYVGSKKTSDGEWNGPTAPKNNNRCTIGGCNAYNNITISGGRLTAVSYSTSAAIGGGGGHNDPVARSEVKISGGVVYAYSYPVYSTKSKRMMPTTAIGGGSTSGLTGPYDSKYGRMDYTYSGKCDVTISGGNVYACSYGGSAIGGGNISCRAGADATATITGGNIIAKSLGYDFHGPTKDTTLAASTAIGGGSAGGSRGYKSGESGEYDDTDHYDGGTATVKIGGSAIVTAGSVGGGTTYWPNGKVGSADITISGGQTSAQFIMAKGAKSDPVFSMTGGYLWNSSTYDSEYVKIKEKGGAVYMESGACTIGGGTIDKCSASIGGAVYMNGGEFKITSGTISNCAASTHGGAVYIDGGNATVTGGGIIKNLASAGNGGGVYVSGGNFKMPDGSTGKINNNSADASSASTDGNGGGIYVRSTTKNVNVDIIGGEIQYNAADRNGGGLCVDMSGSSYTAAITIGKVGGVAASPYIASNSAALSGGGMAVEGSGSNIVINSGTVKGNVSAYVKNEDIRNDGGQVDLVGKGSEVDVNYRTITFYANNGVDPEPYDEQRVITSTNSPLKPTSTALAFQKEFYHMVSWNTKRDGTGTTYNLNGTGEIMNITADVSLYAQWVQNQ